MVSKRLHTQEDSDSESCWSSSGTRAEAVARPSLTKSTKKNVNSTQAGSQSVCDLNDEGDDGKAGTRSVLKIIGTVGGVAGAAYYGITSLTSTANLKSREPESFLSGSVSPNVAGNRTDTAGDLRSRLDKCYQNPYQDPKGRAYCVWLPEAKNLGLYQWCDMPDMLNRDQVKRECKEGHRNFFYQWKRIACLNGTCTEE